MRSHVHMLYCACRYIHQWIGEKAMRILVVKIKVKEENREQFLKAAMIDAKGANHDEPGCRGFDLLQVDDDPNGFYLYEVYDDDAAFQAHLETPHFAVFRDQIDPDWYAEETVVARCTNIYPRDEQYKD